MLVIGFNDIFEVVIWTGMAVVRFLAPFGHIVNFLHSSFKTLPLFLSVFFMVFVTIIPKELNNNQNNNSENKSGPVHFVSVCFCTLSTHSGLLLAKFC